MALPESLPRRREAGFSLVELAISLFVVVEVLLAVLMLFDFTNKMGRVQGNVADMQESLRVSVAEMGTLVRASGRGGLEFFNTLQGGGVWVRDNVGTTATIGDATSPAVLDGTDVLTVRGVFSTPIYQVNYQDTTTLEYKDVSDTVTTNPALAFTGKLKVFEQTTPDGLTLQSLTDAIVPPSGSPGIHEALILEDASNPDVHAVVELLPEGSVFTPAAGGVPAYWSLKFRIKNLPPNTLADSYVRLTPGGVFPPTMKSVSSVGMLEEWRFYVRKVYSIAGNPASELMPKLAKARFMPGTDTAYGPTGAAGNSANLAIDIADDILDLQVALALDTVNHIPRARPAGAPAETPGLTTIAANRVDGYISESTSGLLDDWLYNNSGDVVTDAEWAGATPYWLRMSFVARTDRRDTKYEAPLIGRVEDHIYLAGDPLNKASQRMYRRRLLQTVIDMRNM